MRVTIIKKILLVSIAFSIIGILLSCSPPADRNQKTIGIIVPLEHQAMHDIVAGFTETLRKVYPKSKFKIANAQGDLNLQRAIIQQMKDEHDDLIVPIGTATLQMAQAMIKDQPLLGLASLYTEKERKERQVCNVAIVHDEIPIARLLEFIHAVYPTLSHLVLVHSASEKIYADIQPAKEIGLKLGMNIKSLMVPSLSELYAITHAIPTHTEAILVLKDHLIVSGIGVLTQVAEARHIPLITSDQGSVQTGAGFGLGVAERDIGVEGASLAHAILDGTSPCDLPIHEMGKQVVFVNQVQLKKEQQAFAPIKASADQFHYTVQFVDE